MKVKHGMNISESPTVDEWRDDPSDESEAVCIPIKTRIECDDCPRKFNKKRDLKYHRLDKHNQTYDQLTIATI